MPTVPEMLPCEDS